MIVAQLLLTVDFMGRKGIIHRDLKPENILLNSKAQGVYDLRIADFGFATVYKPRNTRRQQTFAAQPRYTEEDASGGGVEEEVVCGTPGYIAPEALAGEGFTFKSDIFSIGSILFSVLTLKNLFTAPDYRTVMAQNKNCNFDDLDQRMRRCSPQAIDLVRQLLCKDPLRRPTAISALNHPWFAEEKLPLQSSINLNRLLAENKNQGIPQIQRELEQLMGNSLAIKNFTPPHNNNTQQQQQQNKSSLSA